MQAYAIEEYPAEILGKLLDAIAFFRQLKRHDSSQFDTLMRFSKVLECKPGEVVIQQGLDDTGLYFLVRGRLAVFSGNTLENTRRVADISPGEMFGDLALLMRHPRSATVIADTSFRLSLVLALDFEIFGELEDTSIISLATKLTYYRIMVHNLRWKLEMYRSRYPDYPAACAHHKIRLYSGLTDSMNELNSLHQQALQLAQLLLDWNVYLGGHGEADTSLVRC